MLGERGAKHRERSENEIGVLPKAIRVRNRDTIAGTAQSARETNKSSNGISSKPPA